MTGTLGDAAAALALLERDPAHALRARLDRPTPRVRAGLALVGLASACVDISDGLLADLGHVARRSGVGAQVEIDALPASDALCAAFDAVTRRPMQASGGDDYELCFTAPADARVRIAALASSLDLRITRIGRMVAGEGVNPVRVDGDPWTPPRRGYDHFATS